MALFGTFDPEMLKMPLGFIKVLQLPFALIAFTTMDGWGFLLEYKCDEKVIQKAIIDRFALSSIMLPMCNGTKTNLWEHSFGGTALFYGLISLLSLVFIGLMLFVYLFNLELYATDNRLPHADCITTCILGICWVLVAISWWSATSKVLEDTTNENIVKLLNDKHFCGENSCVSGSYSHSSTLTISVLAAWGCAILFFSNIWFAYKETDWFKNRQPFPEPQMTI
uniref:MARVEL domain-containing protein n=1 Tax=Strongyloides papillosus TaxID=174720 RepID=A0A0N5BCT1_STREA